MSAIAAGNFGDVALSKEKPLIAGGWRPGVRKVCVYPSPWLAADNVGGAARFLFGLLRCPKLNRSGLLICSFPAGNPNAYS